MRRGLTNTAAPRQGETDDVLAARISAALDSRLEARSPCPVAVALSGGGDSLALLCLTIGWAKRRGRQVLALTVDHGLNSASDDWTRRAGDMAAKAGAAWRPLPWTGAKPATGLPAAARAARHGLLAQAAREAGARVILLAHTADDAAENAAMRDDGAPGMGRLREWGPSPLWPQGTGVALLRPLLDTRRADLRAWLAARELSWIDDPANADMSHPRIRARRALAAAGALDLDRSLGPTSAPPLFEVDSDGTVRASRRALTQASSEAVLPQLAAALACAGGTAAAVRGRVCADLLGRLRGGRTVDAGAGGALVQARGDAITIGRAPPRRTDPSPTPFHTPAQIAARLGLAIGRIVHEADL